MRRFLSVLLVLGIVLSLVVVVSAKSVNSAKISSSQSAAEPVDYVSSGRYEKTVIIYYTDFDDIPDCVEFSEHSKEFESECAGILYVQKVTRVENMKYEAVFSGELTAPR